MSNVPAKMLVCVWMLGNPVLFLLVVAPTQSHLRPWLPDWFLTVHELVYTWFYRSSAY